MPIFLNEELDNKIVSHYPKPYAAPLGKQETILYHSKYFTGKEKVRFLEDMSSLIV